MKRSDGGMEDGVGGTATECVFDTRHNRYPAAAHLILRSPDGQILLMRRAGTEYGEGRLAFPAGHVDLGETPTASIVRETFEELGITITAAGLTPAGVMFRRSLEPWVGFFLATDTWEGTPRICEPHKCTELPWVLPGQPAGQRSRLRRPGHGQLQPGTALLPTRLGT